MPDSLKLLFFDQCFDQQYLFLCQRIIVPAVDDLFQFPIRIDEIIIRKRRVVIREVDIACDPRTDAVFLEGS